MLFRKLLIILILFIFFQVLMFSQMKNNEPGYICYGANLGDDLFYANYKFTTNGFFVSFITYYNISDLITIFYSKIKPEEGIGVANYSATYYKNKLVIFNKNLFFTYDSARNKNFNILSYYFIDLSVTRAFYGSPEKESPFLQTLQNGQTNVDISQKIFDLSKEKQVLMARYPYKIGKYGNYEYQELIANFNGMDPYPFVIIEKWTMQGWETALIDNKVKVTETLYNNWLCYLF